MDDGHTPTPWRVGGSGTPQLCVTDHDSAYVVDRFLLGDRSRAEHEANVAFVVRACNAHEGLLAALRAERENLIVDRAMTPGSPDRSEDYANRIDAIDAAIAAATGQGAAVGSEVGR